ncbi:MAG: hypothetical protein ACTSU9_01780, partial [Promethearchaeota archaeon]
NENRIEKIEGISHMKKLEQLEMRYNNVKEPTGLAGLPALAFVDLGWNRITHWRPIDIDQTEPTPFPRELLGFPPMKFFDLNELEEEPDRREINLTGCPIMEDKRFYYERPHIWLYFNMEDVFYGWRDAFIKYRGKDNLWMI